MTQANESLVGSLQTFERFGARLAEGLKARVEGEVTSPTPEITSSARDAVCAEAASGALLGRTAWGSEGKEASGCFLWIGAVEALIADGERPVVDLSDGDVETLDRSLRLNVEEGGEDALPMDWAPLERLTAEEVAVALRETGIPEQTEVCRVPLLLKEKETTFLFLQAPAGTPTAAAATPPKPASNPAVPKVDPQTATAAAETAAAITAAGAGPAKNLQHLLNVRMPLTVRLGSTRISLEEVLRLAQGSILELDRREEEPLEVLANEHVIARGEVVVVDERYGLRITEVGSSTERIRASG